MTLIYKMFLGLHFISGLLALAAFWVPMLTRKGSRVHRTAGKLFLISMLVVIVTGLPLSLRVLLYGPWVFGVFLLYLLVLTLAAVSGAWLALKYKREPARFYGPWYRLAAWTVAGSGAVVLGLGLVFQVWLLFLFSFIGLLAGWDMLQTLRATEREPNWWVLEHLGGMIGGGIAAHVAFGAFGLRQLWPAYADIDGWIGMLPWLLPVVAGSLAITLFSRHYRRKPALPARSAG